MSTPDEDKGIEEFWERYAQDVISPQAPAILREHARRAYLAGAHMAMRWASVVARNHPESAHPRLSHLAEEFASVRFKTGSR